MNPKQEVLSTAPGQVPELNVRNTIKPPIPTAEETEREKVSRPEFEKDHPLYPAFYYWVNSRP
jgi:hypothetical protein